MPQRVVANAHQAVPNCLASAARCALPRAVGETAMGTSAVDLKFLVT
jgi:hypothetical protein